MKTTGRKPDAGEIGRGAAKLIMIVMLSLAGPHSATAQTKDYGPIPVPAGFVDPDVDIVMQCRANYGRAVGWDGKMKWEMLELGLGNSKCTELQIAEKVFSTWSPENRPVLLAMEPACRGCTLKMELHCRPSIVDVAGLVGKSVAYVETSRLGSGYDWLLKPWIGQLGATPVVSSSPADWYARYLEGGVDCFTVMARSD